MPVTASIDAEGVKAVLAQMDAIDDALPSHSRNDVMLAIQVWLQAATLWESHAQHDVPWSGPDEGHPGRAVFD